MRLNMTPLLLHNLLKIFQFSPSKPPPLGVAAGMDALVDQRMTLTQHSLLLRAFGKIVSNQRFYHTSDCSNHFIFISLPHTKRFWPNHRRLIETMGMDSVATAKVEAAAAFFLTILFIASADVGINMHMGVRVDVHMYVHTILLAVLIFIAFEFTKFNNIHLTSTFPNCPSFKMDTKNLSTAHFYYRFVCENQIVLNRFIRGGIYMCPLLVI